ncbi:hypothetical protein [Streptomyces sp. NPDC059712]|uniref:hypothetical protein n=1 Tax=Streptomyces sp. NPDC059712 TaxID=3346919 RepID=UPI0036C0DB99
MPSAQPADPARRYVHDDVNEPDDAAVLPLNPHRSRGALRTVRGRWSHMGNDQPARHLHTADEPDTSRHDGVPAVAAFANTIETSFLEIDQSLTNPQTAAAFQRTLDLWERILQGSHAQHVIDDKQLDQLLETLNGMRQAPNLI